jgi:uncharacterized protein (TIGR02452 family)
MPNMGRTEKSQGLAPPAVRKDIRAKQARRIVNKVVPAILASNGRARRGAEGSELIVDPGPVRFREPEGGSEKSEEAQYVKRKGQGRRKAKGGDEIVVREGHEKKGKGKGKRRKNSLDDFSTLAISPATSSPASKAPESTRTIRIVTTDTLTMAHMLSIPPESSSKSAQKKAPNVFVLNMASPLRPGGGVLSGATSQEEFLCARTTLLPSLKETFYRLPEVGGIYTHDVFVFRDASPLGQSRGRLGPGERYWIDVISAGMLRFPELEGQDEEGKGGRLNKKDKEMAEKKMRALLRIAAAKGAKKLVLGAWGCGAYGNPVGDIARTWKKVLVGEPTASSKKSKIVEEREVWEGIEEVVFAITNKNMAHDFAQSYGSGIIVEEGPGGEGEDDDEEDGNENKVAEELRSKIKEMETQLSQVWNPDLKARMGTILDGLRLQLKARDTRTEEEHDDGVDMDKSPDPSSDEDMVAEDAEEGNNDEDDEESTDSNEIYESEEDEESENSNRGVLKLSEHRT